MRNTVSVLGVEVDREGMTAAAERAVSLISRGGAVFTPNPEIIMKAYRDKAYKDVLNRADMVVPDGIGVVIASKILKRPVAQRVTGFDLTCNVLKAASEQDASVYIFGGKEGVAEKAAAKMEKDFGVRVCGVSHGYHKDTAPVLEDMKEKKPGVLLVCLGAPRQEIWIDENKDKIPPCLMMGVGGTVDVFAGEAKRAPEVFIKLNLEWFYRLIKQPSRFIRMLELPKFIVTVLLKRGKL